MSGILATIHSVLPQFHLIFTPDPSFSPLLSTSRLHQGSAVFLPDFTFWGPFLDTFLGTLFRHFLWNNFF